VTEISLVSLYKSSTKLINHSKAECGSAVRAIPRHLKAPLLLGSASALFLALLPVFLAGCVDQEKEVSRYRQFTDAGLKHPAAYQNGDQLTLARSMLLANEDNEQIALQGENYLQALYAKDRVVATFLPTVAFQPSFAIQQAPTNVTETAGVTVTPSAVARSNGYVIRGDTWQSTQAPVTAVESLSVVNYNNLKSQEQIVVQEQQLLIDAQETVLLDVAETYYQVLLSEKQVSVLKDSLDLQNARLADAEGRYRNHLALALEVSQTQAQVASTQAQLTQTLTDVQNGRHALAFLINVPQVDGPLVDEVGVPEVLKPADFYRNLAAQTRPDLLAADSAIRAGKAAVDAAISEYYPSVSLNVTGFLYREYFSNASKWDALLMANLPIFTGGVIEANVRTAWSQLRQKALYQAELKRQIDRDVQIAYDNIVSAERQLTSLGQEVQAASDEYDQARQLLHNGLAIPLDVLTAQNTLLNAQLSYATEAFNITVFYLDLLRITGQLTPHSPEGWRASGNLATGTPTTMELK
jgi:outer membrane protein TolC